MRILHLLSQVEVTGAETYALELVEEQIKLGHDVQIVSDTLHFPTRADYTPRPINNRSILHRIKNYFWLKYFLIENKIDVIHAHSRAASWLAFYTTKKMPIPVVSTVHGRQHIHSSSVGRDEGLLFPKAWRCVRPSYLMCGQ
jgi:glycosyltransferase involved in cell wall biosynthesis